MQSESYVSDLDTLKVLALEKTEENKRFVSHLHGCDIEYIDNLVHVVNETVSAAIDCTACGNCCRSLMINVTPDEIVLLAEHLNSSVSATKEKYIEESMMGNCFINTMPCHFLADNKCTIYEARFKECRDFPHLHKPGFKARLEGTLGHSHRCPIIYNVIEEVKIQTGFNASF